MNTAIPTPRQLEYQDWEMGLFLHFGIRTFYEGHRDWDGKPMDPEAFQPTAFDAEDWVLTAKEAGMKYLVLTAKHHDGFANWPSSYTDFSVASSSWRAGQGDVVGEYVTACHKHGMGCGLYYSPAEWGGTSIYQDERAYDDYFINQISEILQPYGDIDILWFDGCGSEGHEYDWPRIVAEVRRLQPRVMIFNMADPDFRWVGNEAGLAPVPCWNTVTEGEFAGRWLPAECDCRMRAANWFYSDQDEDTVKGLDELLGLHYYSVGRGCNLLINIGPDRRGLLPDRDRARLLEFGAELRRRFGSPLATLADWQPTTDGWQWSPARPTLIDHIVLQEDLSAGEHCRRFVLDIPYGDYPAITLWQGRNIGHKAICQFPPVTAHTVRLRVLESDGETRLRAVEVHCVTGQV
ncbi:MAG: alpha-L-fucosidase [Armatimonadetes bacterium]|nr:alpha-L-fucosidase [Armatimonadota bacterium]